MKRRGRLHCGETKQLKRMVLHDIFESAGRVVICAPPAFHADRFCYGNPNVVNVSAIEYRFENRVAESEGQNILNGFFPQIVVDPKDLIFVQDTLDFRIQFERVGSEMRWRMWIQLAYPVILLTALAGLFMFQPWNGNAEPLLTTAGKGDAFAEDRAPPPGAGGESLINLDDPAHSARRRMVAKYFVPRTIATLEARVRATVDELMAPALDRGQMEVVSELAGPLPSRTIAPIIGLPEDRWVDIRRWSEVLMRFENSSVHPTAWDDAIAVMHEFGELLERTIPERAGLVDGNDLLTLWANAEGVGCPMDPATMIDEVGLFVGGGAETTRTVISRGLGSNQVASMNMPPYTRPPRTPMSVRNRNRLGIVGYLTKIYRKSWRNLGHAA